MRIRTFRKGQRISLSDMNHLRSNQVDSPNTIKNSIGTFQRQIKTAGGPGVTWMKVIRGLLYPDPARQSTDGPEEGYAQYVITSDLSLTTQETISVWNSGTTYPVGYYVIDSADDYAVYKSLVENTNKVPNENPTEWQEIIEQNPRPIGQEFELTSDDENLIDDPPDMRFFIPWFQFGDLVPVYTRSVTVGERTETLVFFAQQMTRCRKSWDGDQSIMWNDTYNRLMAVYL